MGLQRAEERLKSVRSDYGRDRASLETNFRLLCAALRPAESTVNFLCQTSHARSRAPSLKALVASGVARRIVIFVLHIQPICSAKVANAYSPYPSGSRAPRPAEARRGYPRRPLAQARAIIKEVATVTATWRETSKAVGARSAEINRMASAFEHDDLTRALAL